MLFIAVNQYMKLYMNTPQEISISCGVFICYNNFYLYFISLCEYITS